MKLPKNALRLLFYDIQMNDSENWIARSLAQFFRENLFNTTEGEPLLFAIPRKRHFLSDFSPSRFHSSLQRSFSLIQSSDTFSVISANIAAENKFIKVYSEIVAPYLNSRNFISLVCSNTEDRYRKVVSLPNGWEICCYVLARWRRV